MISANQDNLARCPLCPALCPLGLAWNGPDLPRVEYPLEAGTGLCPRGSALGDLMGTPARIRWPRVKTGGRMVEAALPAGVEAAAKRMAAGAVVLLDGNLPLEDLSAAAEVAAAWKAVHLCLVVAPEDEQLLLGLEASGAPYLADEELARCDGFVIVGDAFAANPRCAKGVLDALKAQPRTPLLVIDSGGGVACSFANVKIACRAGGELEALQGQKVAGAVSACKKLAVIVTAEPGRGASWRAVGHAAGKLANSHGGGVSAQTVGANALAAVRARAHYRLMPLAQAMSPGAGAVRVAIGVDVLRLLGWAGPAVPIAASALPNCTTASADVVLPLALPCEYGGTFLQAGTRLVNAKALLSPPAAVPTPAALLRLLAAGAGVNVPAWSGEVPSLDRLNVGGPGGVPSAAAGQDRLLVGSRQAMHQGEGSLTGQAAWQRQLRPLPELRVSPADAEELGLEDLEDVQVQTESGGARAFVRVSGNVAPGTLSISEGYAAARQLMPCVIESEQDAVVSNPAAVTAVKPARAVAAVK